VNGRVSALFILAGLDFFRVKVPAIFTPKHANTVFKFVSGLGLETKRRRRADSMNFFLTILF